MKSRTGYTLVGVAVAGLVLGGAVVGGLHLLPSPAASVPTAASRGPDYPVVRVVRPERRAMRRVVEQPGQIEGFEQTPLYVKISGYVRKLHADIGDRVQAGQVLAELWVPELEEELHQKEASVALAEAQIVQARRALKAAEANLAKAGAGLTLARAGLTRAEAGDKHWNAEYDRIMRLLPSRAVDQATADQTYDQYKSAEAALKESRASIQVADAALTESRAQRDQAEANVRVAEARLRVARADRRRTAAMLEYAMVKAPFDGVVSRRQVDTGHFVEASGSGPNGRALFVVTRTDPVRIFVDVPEADAALVHTGTPAQVRVQALEDQVFEGQVARSSWALDTQTRTLRTEIDLENRDGRLRPGMYATARITVERPGAWTLPAAAVIAGDDETVVLRVEHGKAVRTPVRLGARDGDRVEVLRKQVRPMRRGEPAPWDRFTGDEEVIAGRQGNWSDGQPVRVRESDPGAGPTNCKVR